MKNKTSSIFMKDKVSLEKQKLKLQQSDLGKEYKKIIKRKIRKAEDISKRKEKIKQLEKQIKERKLISRISKAAESKFNQLSKQKVKYKRILAKGKRPTLDLRNRPEREVPVKQHGFKEKEISYKSI